MSDRGTVKVALAFAVLAVGLSLSCAENEANSSIPATDIAGTYNLVSVAGNPVTAGSGSITLNRDGTIVSVVNWGDRGMHNFKGTYIKQDAGYVLTWEGGGQNRVTLDSPQLTMNNEGALFIYEKEGTQDALPASTAPAPAAQSPMDPAKAQKVLDRLLGTWSKEITTYTSGSNPEEKHATGRSSFTRVLHGNFVQEMAEDSEDTFLGLYTYDQRRECYRSWPFLSRWGGPEAPFSGKWNEAAHTLDLICPSADGGSVTLQLRFVSDDAFECTTWGKDMAGKTVWGQEFKFARAKESWNANQPATAAGPPVLGQTAEQKVLDQLLGKWSLETTEFKSKWTPEEKRITGTCLFTRILGGRFVQETWEDSEETSWLIMYTYDEQRRCYRTWVFASSLGGPEVPSSAKWNEATRTLEYYFPENEGQRVTSYMRFVGDNEEVGVYTVQDAAGETLYRAEFKMTRMK